MRCRRARVPGLAPDAAPPPAALEQHIRSTGLGLTENGNTDKTPTLLLIKRGWQPPAEGVLPEPSSATYLCGARALTEFQNQLEHLLDDAGAETE